MPREGTTAVAARASVVTGVLLLIGGGARAQLARPGPPPSPLSCPQLAGALRELVARGGLDHIADTASQLSAPPTSTAVTTLLGRLTGVTRGDGPCPAAIAARGVVKWQLQKSGWIPRDGVGQRAGAPWAEDALRDLEWAAHEETEVATDAAMLGAQGFLSGGAAASAESVDQLGPKLIHALARASRDAPKQLARARLALRLGFTTIADSAIAAYEAAGGDVTGAILYLVRVRLAAGRRGADSLYYAAAADPRPEVSAGLLQDLEPIADSLELRELSGLTGRERAAWLRHFWESRDIEALRPRGSRLFEHYRRLEYARAHYRLRHYPRRYETYELWRNPSAEFDDRGLIYVRHGTPDDSASAVGIDACANVSWLYRRPGGNLIFHFAARTDPDDWRLVETLANVGGENGATNRLRVSGPSCGPVEGLFLSRANLDPVYGRLATRVSRFDLEDELAQETRSRLVGTSTDSDELRFRRTVQAFLQTYSLFGLHPPEGRQLLVLSIPVADLTIGSDSVTSVHLHLVAQQGTRVLELDTTRSLRMHGATGGALTLIQALALDPGPWALGVVIRTSDSAGQYFRLPASRIPDTGRVALSDLVAGRAHGGPVWAARDGALPLNPSGGYMTGEDIALYYEVAAREAGPMSTSIVVSDGHRNLRLSFTESLARGVTPVRRSIATATLKPGPLTIGVTVRAPDGAVATRSIVVRLAKPPRR